MKICFEISDWDALKVKYEAFKTLYGVYPTVLLAEGEIEWKGKGYEERKKKWYPANEFLTRFGFSWSPEEIKIKKFNKVWLDFEFVGSKEKQFKNMRAKILNPNNTIFTEGFRGSKPIKYKPVQVTFQFPTQLTVKVSY